ncbi:TIGR01777 family oxidoreductase [Aeromicrobium sp. NPDC092404]|uniref:TIGR01777 family oxidoreductase n=1 Tax=Aeromicrobium sp. NPDC092404 TaxID=3154976 RepID=UPI0034214D7F
MTSAGLQTVVISGASGYIGQHLVRALSADGAEIRMIGRSASNDATWDTPTSLVEVLDGADLLVNLAGRSVSCRYTKRNADSIFVSRTETTAALGRALAATPQPPELWVNASTGTIYRDARDRPMDEVTGELGVGFSVGVARAWEQELFTAPTPVRRIALRMSIVLGAGGGALNPFINLARLGFGGPMGDGGQKLSWVHVDDVAAAITYAHEHRDISGPVNLAAPEVVSNAEMMRQVRTTLGRSRGLPLPTWALEAGARVIRTEPELVLKSRWIDSRVLREAGFTFAHPTLSSALDQVAGRTPRGLLPVALG